MTRICWTDYAINFERTVVKLSASCHLKSPLLRCIQNKSFTFGWFRSPRTPAEIVSVVGNHSVIILTWFLFFCLAKSVKHLGFFFFFTIGLLIGQFPVITLNDFTSCRPVLVTYRISFYIFLVYLFSVCHSNEREAEIESTSALKGSAIK